MVSLQPFGAFIELAPGREGLCHVSQLDVAHVNEVASVVAVGDKIDVMVMECANGKISLSRKAVLLSDSGKGPEAGDADGNGAVGVGAGEGRPRTGRGMGGGGAGRGGSGMGGMGGRGVGRGRGGPGRRP